VTAQVAAARDSTRLSGLDGVRGLAALFVVLNHLYERAFPGYPRTTAPWWAAPFIYGRFAVLVFIVLSGFSLAYAPARTGWRLGGLGEFARRRAWRILPPYWAALSLSLAAAWLLVRQPGEATPTGQSVLVNGLLVQDLFFPPSPNAAFWSIAIEVHLYLLLPVMLLVARRARPTALVAAVSLLVVAVGWFGPHLGAGVRRWIAESPPDLAALFALGVAAAGAAVADRHRAGGRRWPLLALALGGPVLATVAWRGSGWALGRNVFWVDLALGPSIACLLIGLACGRPAAATRILDTRALRGLGGCSYSLYLTHAPIVAVLFRDLVAPHASPGVPSFLLGLVLIVPVAVGFAVAFAAVLETPFVRHRGWPLRHASPAHPRPHVPRSLGAEPRPLPQFGPGGARRATAAGRKLAAAGDR
jgi:peptidoglycan/LPS O-acetylase OafA/YrhL